MPTLKMLIRVPLLCCLAALAMTAERPRLIVTTDIGGDPDDNQAMVRLMTYANEVEIEALIGSAAGTPGELGTAIVPPDLITARVDAYGQVLPNVLFHDSSYPSASSLRDCIWSGNHEPWPFLHRRRPRYGRIERDHRHCRSGRSPARGDISLGRADGSGASVVAGAE